MSDLSRQIIGKQAAELGFIRDPFEKVYRLVDILRFFENVPLLSKNLALKGGTAINLTIFKLPRLSVDIDLDFTENLPLKEMLDARKIICDTMERFMSGNGYVLNSTKSRQYHTLDSFVYHYLNTGGVKDNIKIEINYSLRSHVLPLTRRAIETLGVFASATVLSLNSIEIFGAKIVALLTRAAARDLYDVYNMICHNLFDTVQEELLRKCIVFYVAVGTDSAPEEIDLGKVDSIAEHEIKTALAPVLRKKERFNLTDAKERVRKYLSELLILTDNERKFLSAFRKREYCPGLLFDGETLERLRNHPMALWKCAPRK
ncbi:MAG: nucleotidyl transferase AbiEii/AbiGii toxin family protein [Syntrophomonadaceae bacterium]|nr:nucleotidyl transferase AbiEii/AbiGii toxin family protein [Syntrophomonadaceae bacterium]